MLRNDYNKYHDSKSGRFTSGWSMKMAGELANVLAMPSEEQAMVLMENFADTDENIFKAFENDKVEEKVREYYSIMTKNGDTTPNKPTSKQMYGEMQKDIDSGKYNDWQDAKKDYIKTKAKMSDAEAEQTLKEFQEWFRGNTDTADRAVLDKYVESDHAYEGHIYRGMRFGKDDFDRFMSSASAGSVIHMKRNSSWSSDKETAYRFGHAGEDASNTIIITCVKNRTSAPVDHLSGYGEGEVLAHSKAGWTVLHSEVFEQKSGAKKAFVTVVETGEYR